MNMRQQAGNLRRSQEAAAVWADRKAEIERLYHVEGWPQSRLAEHYGVTLAGIQKAMKRLDIRPRSRANAGQKNGRYRDGRHSRIYRTMIEKTHCRRCGATETLGIHHVNGDHYDNRQENLMVLCNSCHMSEEKRAWWAAKKAGLPTPKSNGPVGWTS
jgi:hypothetical protein